MKQFIKIMKALSDPSRVKIIKMLQRRMMCICEIQEALGVAQSTASNHLKILEDAGLTTFQKQGLWVNYTLADGSSSEEIEEKGIALRLKHRALAIEFRSRQVRVRSADENPGIRYLGSR